MSYGFKNSITFTAKKAETHDTALEGGEMLLGRYHRFPRFHSIRFNLWLTFVSMTVVMLLIMWVYELIFYSTIYVSLQENEMLTSGNEFAVRYVELAGDEEATEALITEYAADHDVTVVVFRMDAFGETDVLYSVSNSTGLEASGITGALLDYYLDALAGDENYNRGVVTNTSRMEGVSSQMVIYGLKTVLDGDTQYIYMSMPMASFGLAQNTLVGQLAVISVVCLTIGVVVSYFGSGWAARPMRELTVKVINDSRGGKHVPLDTHTKLAEVNELSAAFNKAFDDVERNNRFRRDLLANVSHDMKTPLTMIRAYSEMIRDISGGNKEKCAKQAQVIIDETTRLTALINEVIELSKLEAGVLELHPGVFDISEKLQETVGRFKIMEEAKGYSFAADLQPDLLVRADGERIDRVVYNLIGNAMNYTGEDKTVRVVCRREGDVARVDVIDSGKGMTQEELSTVWDKYYRLAQDKRRVVGSGLGLSIVKSILDLHGVTYGVESEKGKGSDFWFTLPLVEDV